MTDIVERLRERLLAPDADHILDEAADEIERLREALDHTAGFAMSLRLAEKCAKPADLTDEMLRAACDAERAHDHASPCHFCPERCGNGNLAAALRAALRVKDTPTGLEYRGG